jgi:S-adenosylhomocysteine hydrolase
LKNFGARVSIYEPDSSKRLQAQQIGLDLAESPSAAAAGKTLLIGASGKKSISHDEFLVMEHGTAIVSASSEQYEIDLENLKKLSNGQSAPLTCHGTTIGTKFRLLSKDREIHLLADGYPINFWGMNSMPDEASDLVMSLILIASAAVAERNPTFVGINSEFVNKLAKDMQVADKYMLYCRK